MPNGVVTETPGLVTIGGAQVAFDDEDVGLTEGDIEAERQTEVKELEDKIPLTTILQVPIRETWLLRIPMVESGIQNMSRVAANIPVHVQDATPVAVPFGGTPASSQSRTFADNVLGPLQVIDLGTTNISAVTVKNAAENVTYVVNDDYFIDGPRGKIYRNPTGDIPEDGVVHVAWTHTPVAYNELRLGINSPITNRKVDIVHVSPNSGDVYHQRYWKCQGNGSFSLSHKKQDWLVLNAELKATPDSSHPEAPTGFVRRVPQAQAAAYLLTLPF